MPPLVVPLSPVSPVIITSVVLLPTALSPVALSLVVSLPCVTSVIRKDAMATAGSATPLYLVSPRQSSKTSDKGAASSSCDEAQTDWRMEGGPRGCHGTKLSSTCLSCVITPAVTGEITVTTAMTGDNEGVAPASEPRYRSREIERTQLFSLKTQTVSSVVVCVAISTLLCVDSHTPPPRGSICSDMDHHEIIWTPHVYVRVIITWSRDGICSPPGPWPWS